GRAGARGAPDGRSRPPCLLRPFKAESATLPLNYGIKIANDFPRFPAPVASPCITLWPTKPEFFGNKLALHLTLAHALDILSPDANRQTSIEQRPKRIF